MNKKEMEEKILELEEMVRELTSIARLLIKGFKQIDNLTMAKDFIEIARGNLKGTSKNTDLILEIARIVQVDLKKKMKTKPNKPKPNTQNIYI